MKAVFESAAALVVETGSKGNKSIVHATNQALESIDDPGRV